MTETAIQIINPGREPSQNYDNIIGSTGGQSNWKFYFIHSQSFEYSQAPTASKAVQTDRYST